MKSLLLALGLVLFASLPARAAEDAAARAARWDNLRHVVFGDRVLHDGTGVIALEAPTRAMDAALVPVAITLSGAKPVKAVYLLVDGNPSPLAGTFHFGPAIDPHLLKTRVRVEQYTLMHAVAETTDGELFVTERFVKAAGGCSAPAGSDQALALREIGRMKLTLTGDPVPGQPELAELLIRHPNNNGMQMDQLTRNYIPARYIQTIHVTYNDRLVFDFDADISLSEDPALTFAFIPDGPGDLQVTVEDTAKAVFKRSFAVTPQRS